MSDLRMTKNYPLQIPVGEGMFPGSSPSEG